MPSVVLVGSGNGRRQFKVIVNGMDPHIFDVDERYRVNSKPIGRGSYGIVASGVDEVTGTPVAIKKIIDLFEEMTDTRKIFREVLILRLLRENGCRNIVLVDNVMTIGHDYRSFSELYIVTKLYRQNLIELGISSSPNNLNLSFFRQFATQMLCAVSDMHAMGVIHRDIKPANILIDEKMNAVLCDFGLARAGLPTTHEDPLDMTDYVVTRWYRAPELLLNCKYHFPVDIWALGCVLCEVVARSAFFPGKSFASQLYLILCTVPINGTDFITYESGVKFVTEMEERLSDKEVISLRERLGDKIPEDAIDLLRRMLSFDPAQRITAAEALRHPFLDAGNTASQGVPPLPLRVDFSSDLVSDISETQQRKQLWNEVQHYQKQSHVSLP